ncbi:MAG: hypothetical protein WC298_09310 [Sideroxydans sp.]|jgi:hypothetical protein
MHPFIQAWLLQSAVIFLVFGSLAGILTGALLLFLPQRLHRISALLDRWVSTRNMDKVLERNIRLDPWFYRHRKPAGVLTALGSLYVLYFFGVQLDRVSAIAGLVKHFGYHPLLVGGLLDALVLTAFLGSLCALLVALFALFRPSLLRGFEESTNQWLSLRRALKPLELPRDNVTRYVERYARQVGIFFILGGLYTLVLLLIWLSRQG